MVAGRESQFWPCEHAAAAVAGNPNGRSAIVEDSGHAVNIDRPEEFNGLLLDFLHDTGRSVHDGRPIPPG